MVVRVLDSAVHLETTTRRRRWSSFSNERPQATRRRRHAKAFPSSSPVPVGFPIPIRSLRMGGQEKGGYEKGGIGFELESTVSAMADGHAASSEAKALRTEGGHASRTFDVCVRGEGGEEGRWMAATAGEDDCVRLWRSDASRRGGIAPWGRPVAHEATVLRVRWTPKAPGDPSDVHGFASAGDDGVVRVWRTANATDVDDVATCVARLAPHVAEVYACEYLSDDPTRMATCSANVVALWDVERQTKVDEHACAPSTDPGVPERWRHADVFGCASSRDGTCVACTCSDGTLHLLDVRQNRTVSTQALRLHDAMACACAFDPSDRTVASVDVRGRVHVYDRHASRVSRTWDVGSPLFGCAFGRWRGGQALYCTARDGRLHVLPMVEGGGETTSVPVLPPGCALLCCASWEGWILAAGEAERDASYGPFVCEPVPNRAAPLHAWKHVEHYVSDGC